MEFVNAKICKNCEHCQHLYLQQVTVEYSNNITVVNPQLITIAVNQVIEGDNRVFCFCAKGGGIRQIVPESCKYKLEHIVLGG